MESRSTAQRESFTACKQTSHTGRKTAQEAYFKHNVITKDSVTRFIMCSKCAHVRASCNLIQVRSPKHDDKQSSVKGHILNVPFPAEESFWREAHAEAEDNKAFQRLPVLRFAAPQLFIERTGSEEPAKGNKQQWGVITSLKDVFPASSEPSFRTQPSASLSHPDYITRNPGLRCRLESRAFSFFFFFIRAESLSLFSAHFHALGVPGCTMMAALHHVVFSLMQPVMGCRFFNDFSLVFKRFNWRCI